MTETKQALEVVLGLLDPHETERGWSIWNSDAEQEAAAAQFLATHGPALQSALEDARRWRKLGADCFGEGTDHPCLRDDLADWCRKQGMDEAAIDAMAAGEDA